MIAERTLASISGNQQDAGSTVHDLRLDSRTVTTGDVFFSVEKHIEVATVYIQQAVDAGAAAIVIDESQMLPAIAGVKLITIPSLHAKMGAIADKFYGMPSANTCVVGITGTNGKTSCSHWIAQMWSRLSGPAAMVGTLGCDIFNDGRSLNYPLGTTGLTTGDVLSNHRILHDLCSKKISLVAMEVSSHALDQGRVDGIQFDTAIFTNLTRDHLDYHGDMQSYGETKCKLFSCPSLKWALLNADDSFSVEIKKYMQLENNHVNVLTYSLEDSLADIGVERYEATKQGVIAAIRTPWGKGTLQSKYPGGFNLLNVLAVVGTLCSHGMDLQSALTEVSQLQAVPGRTQIVSADYDDVLVIVDYAHTPDALEKILKAVREQCEKNLWCVFGCGGNRDQGKRAIMGSIASIIADRVVVTSDNPRHEISQDIISAILLGCTSSDVHSEIDRAQAIEYAIQNAMPGDAIVIAGKGHEQYQEIAGQRYTFSDVAVAVNALQLRKQSKLMERVR
jgi:UDP-N-acetylmuramoyl-L-alanyl-D-glutamate--2,6-diaminopimelate ligase